MWYDKAGNNVILQIEESHFEVRKKWHQVARFRLIYFSEKFAYCLKLHQEFIFEKLKLKSAIVHLNGFKEFIIELSRNMIFKKELSSSNSPWPVMWNLLIFREKVAPKIAFHSVEKREIRCHAKFFSSNQLRVKFFSK